MENDLYIKLSRIRDDYGIGDRQGTELSLSGLDGFTDEQLSQLCDALRDECDDIEYQINLEKKRCEKGVKWMYGCKNSLKARRYFIDHIDGILNDGTSDDDIAKKFMEAAKSGLDTEVFNRVMLVATQDSDDIFKSSDIS